MISRLFNDDFKDFLKALNEAKVNYLIVGGYAVIIHGHARNTGDLDIWVERSEKNHALLKQAFQHFGMPVFDMTLENFLNVKKFDVFSFGTPPVCIEILTKLKGVEFDEATSTSEVREIDGIQVKVIHLNQLIQAKKAAGRPKDLNDIENLDPESNS